MNSAGEVNLWMDSKIEKGVESPYNLEFKGKQTTLSGFCTRNILALY